MEKRENNLKYLFHGFDKYYRFGLGLVIMVKV